MTAGLARVLHVHEQRPAIRRPVDAGDLATGGTDQEAPDLAALHVRHQHLVVALTQEVPGVREIAIGLDPEATFSIEGQAVGAVERVLGRNVGGAAAQIGGRIDRRVPGQHEQVPLESGDRCCVASGFTPADDLAEAVRGARIGVINGAGRSS